MPDGRVRDWEAEFITLWQQDVPVEAIAEAHHIPLGTAKSRAHILQKEGKITPRPRGRHMLARQERPTISVQPPATPAPQVVPAPPAAPAVTFVAVPEVQEMLSVLKDLQARVMSLEQVRVTPAVPAPPIAPTPPATPATPAPERRDIQQWTIRLSRALIEDVKALAYDRRLHPSEIVEQLLKEALYNRRSE